MRARVCTSSAANGSSISRTLGRMASARAIAAGALRRLRYWTDFGLITLKLAKTPDFIGMASRAYRRVQAEWIALAEKALRG